jgi:hypothetical protein
VFDQNFLDELSSAIASRIRQDLVAASQPKRLMTLEETAIYIGRSPGAVEQMIKRGSLPVTKIDGKRQIDRIELDRIIHDSTHFVG